MQKQVLRPSCLILFLCCCTTLVCAGDQHITKQTTWSSTHYGSFVFQNVTITSQAKVTATVVNSTTRSWRRAMFIVRLADKKGNRVTPLGGPIIFVMNDFPKGATRQLEYSEPGLRLDKFADFSIEFEEDHSTYSVSYVFALVAPRPNSVPTFADDDIHITFNLTALQIGFHIENRSSSPLRLEWDDMAFVDFEGSTHRVIHQGVRLIERNAPQPTTVIPPHASIDDLLYPADYVRWDSSISQWVNEPLWKTDPPVGQQFQIFMPMQINGSKKEYSFVVKVVAVEY